MGAYDGSRLLSPPEWITNRCCSVNQLLKSRSAPPSRKASQSRCAVPPPDPSPLPGGSEVQNQEKRSLSPPGAAVWKWGTMAGGRLMSRCTDIACVLAGQSRPVQSGWARRLRRRAGQVPARVRRAR